MDVSNEKLLAGARNLKAKGFSPEQVDAWLQTKGSSLNAMKSFVATDKPELPAVSDEIKAKIAKNIQNYEKPSMAKKLKNAFDINVAALTGSVEGFDDALGRAVNAATLGGFYKASELFGGNEYRKHKKLQDRNRAEGLGTADTIAGLAVELPANMATSGAAIYDIVGKAGLKGLGRIAGAAALEGGMGNAIQSERLADIPVNAFAGSIIGAGMGAVPAIGVKGAEFVSNSLRPTKKAMQRALNQIMKMAGGEQKVAKAAEAANQRGRAALEVGNREIAQAADQARLGSREANQMLNDFVDAQVAIKADANRQVIDDVFGRTTKAQNTDAIIEKTGKLARPIYDRLNNIGDLQYVNIPQATRYRGGDKISVLKSIRRNMEKSEPSFSMAKTSDGRIDYPHFLKDRQRADYIGTLPATYKFPDNVLSGINGRRVLVKRYYNPENGKHLYDFGIKSDDGTLISKFAREGKSGRDYAESLKKGQSRTSAGGQPSQTGQMGDTPVPAGQRSNNITPIGEFVKNNDAIQKEIRKIRNDPSWDKAVRTAPDTDFRVLDAVKKSIDDQIAGAWRSGYNDLARRLEIQKKGLLDVMDAIIPEYKMARQYHEIKGKVLAAQKIGEKSLDGKITAETLARDMRKMLPAERQAVGIGMKENILSNIGSKENEALALKQLLNQNNQNKLRLVLGKRQANNIINYVRDEVSAYRNFNESLKGSQTAERLKASERAGLIERLLKNPVGFLGEGVDWLSKPAQNEMNKAIVELLTEKGGTKLNRALQNQAYQAIQDDQLVRLLSASGGMAGSEF